MEGLKNNNLQITDFDFLKLQLKELELPDGLTAVDDMLTCWGKRLANEANLYLVEGLKLKGFSFEDDLDVIKFVSSRCVVTVDEATNMATYYVDGVPFLARDFRFAVINTSYFDLERNVIVAANRNGYFFL